LRCRKRLDDVVYGVRDPVGTFLAKPVAGGAACALIFAVITVDMIARQRVSLVLLDVPRGP